MSKENKNKKQTSVAQGALTMFLMVMVIVLALVIANWIPGTFTSGLMSEFSDIKVAQNTLRLKYLYVPTYFPESVSWPPSKVFAQTRPYEAVVLEFKGSEAGEPLLLISQSATRHFNLSALSALSAKLQMGEVLERSTYEFKGRSGALSAGLCADGGRCSMLSWQEGDVHLDLLMSGGPFELISIAESMVSGQELPRSSK